MREKTNEEIQADIKKLQGNLKTEALETEYKGRPTLTFQGAGKPFSLGTTKLRRIMECEVQVKAFLSKHQG